MVHIRFSCANHEVELQLPKMMNPLRITGPLGTVQLLSIDQPNDLLGSCPMSLCCLTISLRLDEVLAITKLALQVFLNGFRVVQMLVLDLVKLHGRGLISDREVVKARQDFAVNVQDQLTAPGFAFNGRLGIGVTAGCRSWSLVVGSGVISRLDIAVAVGGGFLEGEVMLSTLSTLPVPSIRCLESHAKSLEISSEYDVRPWKGLFGWSEGLASLLAEPPRIARISETLSLFTYSPADIVCRRE